jgi:D-alanyl-D-alanine carboxypeptidase
MTLGWHIGELNGTRFFYKEGGGRGFHSMMRVYPVSKIRAMNDEALAHNNEWQGYL